MKSFIPVNEPLISSEAKANVIEALRTGWVSSSGRFVQEFEEEFAKYLGMKQGITVTSGTAALHIALLALGVCRDDEVIVPAFTMASTWLAVLYTGATPIFVDATEDTFNIDVEKVEEKISKKTKAIIAVHIYGHPVDMDPLLKLAKKYKLKVIEDAAEAHGALYKGKKTGTMGDINCFSFYANKIISTGEGGMVVTNNDGMGDEARKLKDLYHSEKRRFIHPKIGFNYRMTNMQAGLGLGELKHIESYISKKEAMASLYNKLLRDIPGLRLPITKKGVKNVFWMYAILVDEDKFGMSKDVLREKLKAKMIDTRDFFYPPSEQPVLGKYLQKKDKFPVAERLSKEGLYLPSGLALTKKQIKRTAHVIHEIWKENLDNDNSTAKA